MSSGQNNQSSIVGDEGSHQPVMLDEVLQALGADSGQVVVDGTFGAGGYSGAIAKTGAKIIAIDRDESVLPFAEALEATFGDQFVFIPGRFSQLDELVLSKTDAQIDGVVLDIGVSSMQLDQAERGFSFMRDGPLDMRMGVSEVSAADLVNNAGERELSDILFTYGEEKRARRIAKAIIVARGEAPIETTLQLAEIIENEVGRKPGSNHPATKSFQALRIAVNQEMNELVQGLFAAERLLQAGAVLIVVTFHSLEDRIVKRFFDAKKSAGTVSRHMPISETIPVSWEKIAKPLKATAVEISANPRARSATLRCARRSAGAARKMDYSGLGVPGYKLFGEKLVGST